MVQKVKGKRVYNKNKKLDNIKKRPKDKLIITIFMGPFSTEFAVLFAGDPPPLSGGRCHNFM
jgi:hypothetical protein